jgi:WD40 repeat protein
MQESSKQQNFCVDFSIIALISCLLILVACNTNFVPSPTINPTIIFTSTSTSTKVPATPTITPTSTKSIKLPVGLLTPVPFSETIISENNVKGLQEIAFYKSGITGFVNDIWHSFLFFRFRNDDFLSLNYWSPEPLNSRTFCDLFMADGSIKCQENHIENSNLGFYEGQQLIIGTDGNYYGYDLGSDREIGIYPIETPNQVIATIPNKYRNVIELEALDLTNNVVIYNKDPGVYIQDSQDDSILFKWDNAHIFPLSVKISKNQKYAAFCLYMGAGADWYSKDDKFVIYDLKARKIVNFIDMNCNIPAIDFSPDESKLVLQNASKDTSGIRSENVTVLNLLPPSDNEKITYENVLSQAAAFSPDGTILAVSCADAEICFLDPSDLVEIYRLKTQFPIKELAFSKDGKLLAVLSDQGFSIYAVPTFNYQVNEEVESSPLIPNK